jgi:hypothetical protein
MARAEVVLVEEVVGDREPRVELDVMRTEAYAEADDRLLRRVLRIGDVQHPDLAGFEQTEERAVARLVDPQQPCHPAAHQGCTCLRETRLSWAGLSCRSI